MTLKSAESSALPAYTAVYGQTMLELARKESKMVVITAAMASGTGLTEFAEQYPDRFHDVGIAEQHAVCFAAGLAAGGARPVCALYSTFLQRAYDQIIHDVALQRLPVVFCIDRGGLVGEDGPTHHGAFDLSYLRAVPNMTVAAPADGDELKAMLEYAVTHNVGPVAVRYPRGSVPYEMGTRPLRFEWGRWEVLSGGTDLAVIAAGSMVAPCRHVVEMLKAQGINASLINGRFIKPFDIETLNEIAERFDRVVTVEENSINGGFGSGVLDYLDAIGYRGRVLRLAIPDRFIPHGSRKLLLREIGLDEDGIMRSIGALLKPRRSLLGVLSLRRNGRKASGETADAEREESAAASKTETIDDDK